MYPLYVPMIRVPHRDQYTTAESMDLCVFFFLEIAIHDIKFTNAAKKKRF